MTFYDSESVSSAEIPLKAVEVFRFDDALQVEAILPVFFHLHAAPLPHGGGKAQLIIGEQHPDGMHPVAEGLIQLFEQGLQAVARFGAGQQDVRVKAESTGFVAFVVNGQAGDVGTVSDEAAEPEKAG